MIFHCARWHPEREVKVEAVITPENLATIKVSSVETWQKVEKMRTSIMKQKEKDERHRQVKKREE